MEWNMISGTPFSFTLIVMSMMLNVTNFTENFFSLLPTTLSLACSYFHLLIFSNFHQKSPQSSANDTFTGMLLHIRNYYPRHSCRL